MQALEKEQLPELDPETLEQMSRLLAETLLEQIKVEDAEAQLAVVTCVGGYEIIREDQIMRIVQLDLIASATAGVLDPLGQLQEWLSDLINSVASWVVSAIESFIETYVLPAIDAVASGIQSFIETYVLPAIDAVASGIQSFIETYVLPAIDSVTSAVFAFIETYVLPAIDAVASGIQSFIETYVLPAIDTVISTLKGAIDGAIITLSNQRIHQHCNSNNRCPRGNHHLHAELFGSCHRRSLCWHNHVPSYVCNPSALCYGRHN